MDTKKPADKPQLLKELADLKSLLGEDDIPVVGLEPSTEASPAADIPTLSVSERARTARNPFLQSGPVEAPANLKPLLRSDIAEEHPSSITAESRPNPFLTPRSRPTAPAAPSDTSLSQAQQRALVDELLAQWMPKIERELRNRLLDVLNNKSS